jgi:hypothetical protein
MTPFKGEILPIINFIVLFAVFIIRRKRKSAQLFLDCSNSYERVWSILSKIPHPRLEYTYCIFRSEFTILIHLYLENYPLTLYNECMSIFGAASPILVSKH